MYLQKLPNGLDKANKLAPNTITTALKRFHSLFNKAKTKEVYSPPESIMKALERTWEPTTKAKLTDDEIKSIIDLDLPPETPIWHARNEPKVAL